jgi:hypothetical protein
LHVSAFSFASRIPPVQKGPQSTLRISLRYRRSPKITGSLNEHGTSNEWLSQWCLPVSRLPHDARLRKHLAFITDNSPPHTTVASAWERKSSLDTVPAFWWTLRQTS